MPDILIYQNVQVTRHQERVLVKCTYRKKEKTKKPECTLSFSSMFQKNPVRWLP